MQEIRNKSREKNDMHIRTPPTNPPGVKSNQNTDIGSADEDRKTVLGIPDMTVRKPMPNLM